LIVIDTLLWKGLRFVLNGVTTAVDAERDDESAIKEGLLEARMRTEIGEIDEAEYARIEAELLGRLREIRRARGDEVEHATLEIAGAEVSIVEGEGDR
jgi:hypothetical protein